MELTSTAGRPVTERTADMWSEAVLRSIGTMRENLGEELSLRTLARSAWLSPFHFHRVFHRLTDSTPARFLAAWRIAEAKRRLAYSEDSVTDVCMHVGYASLGTFTSQFTRVVGVSPGRFRRLV
jgi:AraC family transcriptional regulator